MTRPRVLDGPLLPSKKINRRLMFVSIVGGILFMLSSFVIAVVALDGVKTQQNFLCGLIGQSIVQQRASLDSRVKGVRILAQYDSSAEIRAYERAQLRQAISQRDAFLNPSVVRNALGGRCAAQIEEAQKALLRGK